MHATGRRNLTVALLFAFTLPYVLVRRPEKIVATTPALCGSRATSLHGQTMHGVTHVRLCTDRVSIGEVPEYKYSVIGNPDLHSGGRGDAFLALQYQKETASIVTSSVVMSVYNAAPALLRSLPPLFVLTAGSWELIIVLDACYDSSYEVAAKVISEHFHGSSCVRVRVYVQPTAVWEVSSDNIGMRLSDARDVFILVQADNILLEEGWNLRMLRHLAANPEVFSISGRCAHSFNETNQIGRCGEDIAKRLSVSELRENVLHFRETGNRGPLMLRAGVTRQLGFLDEAAHLLGDDDHDLNMRARKLGYVSAYLPIGSFAPMDLSARRNPDFRKSTPKEVIEEELKYKHFRLKMAHDRRQTLG